MQCTAAQIKGAIGIFECLHEKLLCLSRSIWVRQRLGWPNYTGFAVGESQVKSLKSYILFKEILDNSYIYIYVYVCIRYIPWNNGYSHKLVASSEVARRLPPLLGVQQTKNKTNLPERRSD